MDGGMTKPSPRASCVSSPSEIIQLLLGGGQQGVPDGQLGDGRVAVPPAQRCRAALPRHEVREPGRRRHGPACGKDARR